MDKEEMKKRTKAFALRAIKLASSTDLYKEADEILSIVVSSIKTARRRL
jgi:hypothetical protein